MNMPSEMFLTIQLVHFTCRKDSVQLPTRKEGWDLFQRTSDDSSIFTLIIQDEEQYDDTFKERRGFRHNVVM